MHIFWLLAITLVFCTNVLLCETLNKSSSAHYEKDNIGSCGSPDYWPLPKEVSYNYASEKGTLTVYNIPVPPYCPSVKYEVHLFVNSSECFSAKSCNCSRPNDFTKYTSPKIVDKNSKRKLDDQNSNESCSSSTRCSDFVKTPTEGSFNVTFSDVFSGFYCMKVATVSPARNKYYHVPVVHHPFVVNSPKPIDDPSCWLPLMYPIKQESDRLELKFTMNKICSDSQFFHNSQFLLILKNAGFCNSQDTELEKVELCHTLKPGTEIFSHTFQDLRTGNYCLEIRRLDCHCKSGTFCTNERCSKRAGTNVTIGSLSGEPGATITIQDDLPRETKNILLISLTCSIACILSIFLGAMLYAKRQFCFSKITDSTTDNELPITVVNVSKTVPVLLLYAMDNNSLREQALRFRHILDRIGFCEVCDIFDNEMYDCIATYGETYITTLLARPEYQIIVVTSKLAVETQKSILGFADGHDGDKGPMFDLYVKALKAVMVLANENVESYRRIHLVRFPDVTPPNEMVSFITPFRCYLVPRNLRTLLCHLHGFGDHEIIEGNDGLWKGCCEEWKKISCAEILNGSADSSSEYLLAI